MTGLETAVYILLVIWLALVIFNTCIQISISIKQHRHTRELEEAIKDFDGAFEETLNNIKRQNFFNEIEQMKHENEEGDDKNGRE